MALQITIDIFSGRPNPVINLTSRQASDALARLKPVVPSRGMRWTSLPSSILGYRGLIIEQVGAGSRSLPRRFRLAGGYLLGPDLRHRASDENFEEFVCGSTGPIRKLKLGRAFSKQCLKEIHRFRRWWDEYRERPIKWPPVINPCQCAPIYEPGWWNDGGQKQFNNNCYNYATNYRTDTFAQPGRASGAMYTALSCAAVRPAAVSDALIATPKASNTCPRSGHRVALVIAPGWDFHWYRKGQNGYWTHKPGGTAATNLDNSGVTISDPRTADRGPYTQFCTFMVVMHGHIKIN